MRTTSKTNSGKIVDLWLKSSDRRGRWIFLQIKRTTKFWTVICSTLQRHLRSKKLSNWVSSGCCTSAKPLVPEDDAKREKRPASAQDSRGRNPQEEQVLVSLGPSFLQPGWTKKEMRQPKVPKGTASNQKQVCKTRLDGFNPRGITATTTKLKLGGLGSLMVVLN